MTNPFDNIGFYNDYTYTDYITEECREDAKQAWKYARHRGHPMNYHITVCIPSSLQDIAHPVFQRTIANKLRVYAAGNGFPAHQLMHRSCDVGTCNNPKIDILFHVPTGVEKNFIDVVSKWPNVTKISAVNYEETTLADGTISSAFNDIFSATSPVFAAKHPELPYKASGPVLGDRTFYSRNLWLKERIKFWRAKRK